MSIEERAARDGITARAIALPNGRIKTAFFRDGARMSFDETKQWLAEGVSPRRQTLTQRLAKALQFLATRGGVSDDR